ncbi:MAG: M4 family metallopeptidase [Nocardioidaceae bacterium]
MKHRSALVALVTTGLMAVGLTQPPAALADLPVRSGSGHPGHPGPAGRAVARLRADAPGPVRVRREPGGPGTALGSPEGEAVVGAPAGTRRPVAAAAGYVRRYGPALHVDGGVSTARSLDAVPTATGGTVVRADQAVDGMPVFGGELVMSLDHDNGLVSMSGATTEATSTGPVTVPVERARQAAVAVAAKAQRVSAENLSASDQGLWLYDPALVGVDDPRGVRPVWRFELSDGLDVRETVLIDAGDGGVALHLDETPDLTRVVCDGQDDSSRAQVPACTQAVRTETSGASDEPDVDAAFDNVGETADFYRQVAGVDLGELIGTGPAGSRRLQSWVRWCYSGEACPMRNASWDGTHMVFGDGYAAADDVVAHELTHGVVDRTSQLFYLHQSGAINESLADVIGEIVDHRNGTDDDSAWTLGEDVPGGPIRSMKDPTLYGQPDRMGSPFFSTADAFDDEGAVHTNSGVGNKAAYLISQGGTFQGVAVRGIDAGDPGLTKTATLYTEVIKRLTSGAQYADLARTLESTCDELAAAGTDRFEAADCASVRAAVRATGMDRAERDPAAGSREAPDTCPTGTVKRVLFHDDDGSHHPWRVGALWGRAPSGDVPGYASSGTQSWFGFEPDPDAYDDPYSSSLRSATPVRVPRGGRTYLHFHHAYLLEWYDATATKPAFYPDGGRVRIWASSASGWRRSSRALRWVNGPDKLITSSSRGVPWAGFGGDSNGYGSSRVDLTPLAGHRVEPEWQVVGDSSGDFMGWYVDDVEIYQCAHPSRPRAVTVHGTSHGVVVRWRPPAHPAPGVVGYRVRRSDGVVRTVRAGARSVRIPGLPAGRRVGFAVQALGRQHTVGPAARVTVPRSRLTGR